MNLFFICLVLHVSSNQFTVVNRCCCPCSRVVSNTIELDPRAANCNVARLGEIIGPCSWGYSTASYLCGDGLLTAEWSIIPSGPPVQPVRTLANVMSGPTAAITSTIPIDLSELTQVVLAADVAMMSRQVHWTTITVRLRTVSSTPTRSTRSNWPGRSIQVNACADAVVCERAGFAWRQQRPYTAGSE